MSRRAKPHALCLLLAAALAGLCAALLQPASALAAASSAAGGSGGAGISGGATATVRWGPRAQAGNVTVTAAGDGITLAAPASGMLSHQLSFSGSAPSAAAGETVEIERMGHQTHWLWVATARATVAGDGTFSAVWPADHIGRFAIRALIMRGGSSYVASTLPTVTVTVYRIAKATQYGPGFYGSKTACGARLRPSTIGVANRTLPCGSRVAVYYRGRTLVVPVIDRGPYANGADWDLTEATARALGIDGTAEIGAVSLPRRPAPRPF